MDFAREDKKNMSPDKHIISGIILGAGTYVVTRDIVLSGTSCLAAFICDVDHMIEYGAYCIQYKVKPSIKEFFSGEYFEKKNKICIIFHAYEYLLALIIAAICTKNHVVIGMALGYALHMFLDTIGNDCTFTGYCISYRIKVHFQLDKICVKNRP